MYNIKQILYVLYYRIVLRYMMQMSCACLRASKQDDYQSRTRRSTAMRIYSIAHRE